MEVKQDPLYYKEWYAKNKERKLLQAAQYRSANLEKCNAKSRAFYAENKKEMREQRANYIKNKRATDINFKIAHNLRVRLNCAIKNGQKAGSAVKDLGCSVEFFKNYIESKFTEGMSWKNYGEWHLDHIVPISKFELSDREQLLKACHYSNLQPLWALDNKKKLNKVA